jgi:hypothetical protein
MRRVTYKGYTIEARPHQLADDSRWTLNITISRDDGEQLIEQTFSAANLFATEEEAVQHCLNFGRQIVDGQVAGCTAP